LAQFDVYGICNPLYDIQAEVPDRVLEQLGFAKGGMFLVDHEQQRKIVPTIYEHIVHTEAGGSGANTMIGLALLGGSAAYSGHIGLDEHGQLYRKGLEDKHVRPNLGSGPGNTGVCLVLVTPDTQRTMLTYLGVSPQLSADDIDLADLQGSKYLYITGYLWDTDSQKAAVKHAMSKANEAGVKVALSLSDPFCVTRHKGDFAVLIKNHVSLLFGNCQEAMVLTDTSTPEEAVKALHEFCDTAVVTMDATGSLIQNNGVVTSIPAYPVEAVDTTGAGDMYAAGLLYGLTQGLPIDVTGRIAAYVAAKVVAKLGPRLESIDLAIIERIKAGASFEEIKKLEEG
jgi:sugar/nucleoside kinase (ribokinase family)